MQVQYRSQLIFYRNLFVYTFVYSKSYIFIIDPLRARALIIAHAHLAIACAGLQSPVTGKVLIALLCFVCTDRTVDQPRVV